MTGSVAKLYIYSGKSKTTPQKPKKPQSQEINILL